MTVAVAMGALIGCGDHSDDDTATTTATTTPAARLDAPASQLTWTTFNGMTIPEAQQGPKVKDGVAPHGFERTPPGAALAAINASIRIAVATDAQWPTVVRTEIAPGPTRDAFITNRIQLSTTNPVPAGQAPRVLGWKVTSFHPESATVDIFTGFPDQSLAVNHTTVVWTAADDWGLVLPDTHADATNPVEAIASVPTDAVSLKGP